MHVKTVDCILLTRILENQYILDIDQSQMTSQHNNELSGVQ